MMSMLLRLFICISMSVHVSIHIEFILCIAKIEEMCSYAFAKDYYA